MGSGTACPRGLLHHLCLAVGMPRRSVWIPRRHRCAREGGTYLPPHSNMAAVNSKSIHPAGGFLGSPLIVQPWGSWPSMLSAFRVPAELVPEEVALLPCARRVDFVFDHHPAYPEIRPVGWNFLPLRCMFTNVKLESR